MAQRDFILMIRNAGETFTQTTLTPGADSMLAFDSNADPIVTTFSDFISGQGLATEGFVAAAIANLVASSPSALDTLNELAAALGNDANFATTVTNALAGKVPTTRTVNGHALSGDVTVSKSDVGLGNVTDNAQLKASDLDTDETLAANSDSKIPSQQAVKGYVDAQRGEVLTADFVTTSASAGDLEMIFTNVPCTSGKTYLVETEFWIKWATAATSGDATIANSTASPGHPTFSENRMIAFIDSMLVGLGTGGIDGTNAVVTASAGWQRYIANGFFTATETENFNYGINVPGWDSGDVVTIAKGARLKVTQVD